jgi:hypothetical protein
MDGAPQEQAALIEIPVTSGHLLQAAVQRGSERLDGKVEVTWQN